MGHRRIILETVAPDKMRYDTLGDWFFDENGDIRVQVAVTGDVLDTDEAFLVALHELIELKLCRKRGISQGAVDQFDMHFSGDGEPGDDPRAPYRREHRYAMLAEHGLAHELGITGYGGVT